MPSEGHVNKPRLVVNSTHDVQTVEKLLGLSQGQCLKNFHLGNAMAVKRITDHMHKLLRVSLTVTIYFSIKFIQILPCSIQTVFNRNLSNILPMLG